MALAGVVIEPPLMSLVERDCSASAVSTALMLISVEKSDVSQHLGPTNCPKFIDWDAR